MLLITNPLTQFPKIFFYYALWVYVGFLYFLKATHILPPNQIWLIYRSLFSLHFIKDLTTSHKGSLSGDLSHWLIKLHVLPKSIGDVIVSRGVIAILMYVYLPKEHMLGGNVLFSRCSQVEEIHINLSIWRIRVMRTRMWPVIGRCQILYGMEWEYGYVF